MDTKDCLKQLKELKEKLDALSSGNVSSRDKISVMSAEVVDSNPYRWVIFFCYIFTSK